MINHNASRLVAILALGVVFSLLAIGALAVAFLVGMKSPPPPTTQALALADLDGDGSLDAVTGHICRRVGYLLRPHVGNNCRAVIWFNDGAGNFREGNQRLTYSQNHALALGDVNGDGTIDVVAAYKDQARVWLNDGSGAMQLSP